MVVLVDTREQQPFFKRGCKRICLKEGDYTTELLLNKFHIERKSLQDLYSTIIHNHARFRREIIRAELRDMHLVVVVEGTYANFVNKKFPKGNERKTTTIVLRKIIATIKRRYGLEIIFCKNRLVAKNKTLNRLRYEEAKIKRQKNESSFS